jgi:hypothetical protein
MATMRAVIGQMIRLRHGTATRTVNLAEGQTHS